MQDAKRETLDSRASRKSDLLIAVALTLFGVLTRIPYLALIPRFEDEVMQTVYALTIRPGEFMPLVGNDPYAGPMFSYILAVCLRLFGASPVSAAHCRDDHGRVDGGADLFAGARAGVELAVGSVGRLDDGCESAPYPRQQSLCRHDLRAAAVQHRLSVGAGAGRQARVRAVADCSEARCWDWPCRRTRCRRSCCRA